MPGTYNASEIIGKNLIAKKVIDLRRLPDLAAPIMYEVQPGDNVGVVESYINAKNNNPLFWQFKDNTGRFYYAEHKPGYYSEKVVRDQGAATTEEIKKEKEEEKKTTFDKVQDTVKTLGFFFIAGLLISKVANK